MAPLFRWRHGQHLGHLAALARCGGLPRLGGPLALGRVLGGTGLLGRLGVAATPLATSAPPLAMRSAFGCTGCAAFGFAASSRSGWPPSVRSLKWFYRRDARQAVPNGHQPLRRPTGDQFCQFLRDGEGIKRGGGAGSEAAAKRGPAGTFGDACGAPARCLDPSGPTCAWQIRRLRSSRKETAPTSPLSGAVPAAAFHSG